MNYPRPGPGNKYTRMRDVAARNIKRFGPLVLTGLAAVAEQHWLKRDDPRESNNEMRPGNIRDDRSSIQELRDQVEKLRRMLQRAKGKKKKETTSDASSTTSDQTDVLRGHHHRRPSFHDRQTGEPVLSEPVLGHQDSIPKYLQGSQNIDVARREQASYETPGHTNLHHHRHSFPHDDFSPEAIYAGKVAALAGAVEALHVGDLHGDWIGSKGVRVGTTMAATFASSYARDRDTEDVRRRDVVADVGTGLVVTRLVHGSSRRIEEDYQRQRGRRWSYWY